ncbi:PH domain-containing protein [Pseudoalteromonas sp. T1lg88]|uniref:PH domain-containing protein n=1 Tax=Pseudoalteromonas sp. T1lg88 TaxID=2077104 RepID=UPI000CF6B331|nr:PH domain-containing protein [Pseudoalteromonas sp. T1lg88]
MMSSETILNTAQFDPRVKQYWLTIWLLVASITLFGIALLPIVAVLVWWLGGRILAAMSATLSEKKLVVKRGIWVREEKSIPLDKITDVAMTQGPLMRVFGLHRLSFETAGQSGPGALVSLLGVVDAHHFREAILTQKERAATQQGEHHHGQSAAQGGTNQDNQALMQRLVDAVERIDARLARLEQEPKATAKASSEEASPKA